MSNDYQKVMSQTLNLLSEQQLATPLGRKPREIHRELWLLCGASLATIILLLEPVAPLFFFTML
jgi:hypothetical protein